MSARRPRVAVLGLVAVGAAALVLRADVVGEPARSTLGGGVLVGRPEVDVAGSSGHPLTVSLDVTGQVRPGRPATVVVTVTNAGQQPIDVTSVVGTVLGVTSRHLARHPVCDRHWYAVGSSSGHRVLARGASTRVTLPVSLTDLAGVDQDDCQGSQVSLGVIASGSQA